MNIARRIKKMFVKGIKVIVVVSAMGKTTDGLINLAKEISSKPPKGKWTCCYPLVSKFQ